MARLQFKQKCKYCRAVWVLVQARKPVVCDQCKRKYK